MPSLGLLAVPGGIFQLSPNNRPIAWLPFSTALANCPLTHGHKKYVYQGKHWYVRKRKRRCQNTLSEITQNSPDTWGLLLPRGMELKRRSYNGKLFFLTSSLIWRLSSSLHWGASDGNGPWFQVVLQRLQPSSTSEGLFWPLISFRENKTSFLVCVTLQRLSKQCLLGTFKTKMVSIACC